MAHNLPNSGIAFHSAANVLSRICNCSSGTRNAQTNRNGAYPILLPWQADELTPIRMATPSCKIGAAKALAERCSKSNLQPAIRVDPMFRLLR